MGKETRICFCQQTQQQIGPLGWEKNKNHRVTGRRARLKGRFCCPTTRETNPLPVFVSSVLPCVPGWSDEEGEKASCHKNMLVLTALEPQRGCKLCAVT